MLPQFVTFTGIDDNTDLDHLGWLALRHPIEWGVLFGGRIGSNRYPSADTVCKLLDIEGLRISAHLCGSFATRAVMPGLTEFFQPEVWPFARFQINAGRYDMAAIQMFQSYVKRPVIIQVRGKTFPELVWEGVTFLHDKSGGKGRQPKSRPVQPSGMSLIGHAGGICPENVAEVVAGLDAHNYYLDMETGVRTNDWFDLDKCEMVCREIWR